MNLISAEYEILELPENPARSIERAARTCYKSEKRIDEDGRSAETLTTRLLKRNHQAMIEFGGWVVVKFTSNRGFSHELVRHRLASFAQESTRYCNYSKGKFGSSATFIHPKNILNGKVPDVKTYAEVMGDIIESWLRSESDYMKLVEKGCPAEIAREVLPIGIKAEIVIGATVRQWRHIFSLRCSKAAHPRMRELMIPLRDELRSKLPVVFDDIESTDA